MTSTLETLRSDFIEKIGLQAQNDGLPRIAGRVLGLLIWDGTAVSFGDLATKLQVSRGSISSATRILEERRLIRRTAKPGERLDYFQLSENPYASMLAGIKVGLERSRQEIDSTLNAIPEDHVDIKGRVAAYSRFYEKMAGAVDDIIKDVENQ